MAEVRLEKVTRNFGKGKGVFNISMQVEDGDTNIHTVLLLPEVYSSGIQHSHLQVIQLISMKTTNVQAVLLERDFTEERAAIGAKMTRRKGSRKSRIYSRLEK